MEQFKELGAIGGLIALGYVLIKEVFAFIGKKTNGYDKKTYEVSQKIATNDLVHINDCLEKGFDKMLVKQDKTNELLYEMIGILKAK